VDIQFYCCSYVGWYNMFIRMTIILQSVVLTVVIFVVAAAIVQPLIDKVKIWLDL